MKNNVKFEERYFFMWLLTFIGGYSNGYSYFTRDGAFVSFQTGNIAKVGLSAVTLDSSMFFSGIVPICGALLGAVLGQIIKANLSKRSARFWQKAALVIELLAFFVAGWIPASNFSTGIVFFLAATTMFQLSNFRSLEGSVHNTTIETGNLRTFGQHFGDFLLKRDLPAFTKAIRYFAVFAAFPIGVAVGGWITRFAEIRSIWLCCLILLFLLITLSKAPSES